MTVFVPSWRKEQPRPDAPITGKDTRNVQSSRQIVLIQQIEVSVVTQTCPSLSRNSFIGKTTLHAMANRSARLTSLLLQFIATALDFTL